MTKLIEPETNLTIRIQLKYKTYQNVLQVLIFMENSVPCLVFITEHLTFYP